MNLEALVADELKVNDVVYVNGYCRTRFRIAAIKKTAAEPYHIVYAAANGDRESEFGWCTQEEIRKDF